MKTLMYFIIGSVLFVGCRKDRITDDYIDTFNPPLIEHLIQSDVLIEVTYDGKLLEGVTIDLNGQIGESDESGIFLFANIDISDKGSLIQTQMDGFFHNSTFVKSTNKNATQLVRFELEKYPVAQKFSASTGTTLTAEASRIIIQGNGIQDELGQPYSGNVNAYTRYLDPTDESLNRRMPGDLRALNAQNQRTNLQSFGMVDVILEDDSGNPLQLVPEVGAELHMRVPDELVGIAPAEIPLWHFDEITGYWMEEGSAILSGLDFIGFVSHFSTWNTDIQWDLVEITGKVVFDNGTPCAFCDMTTYAENISGKAWGKTDDSGCFVGLAPLNIPYLMAIAINDDCPDRYVVNMPAIQASTNLGNITVSVEVNTYVLSGIAKDCQGLPLQDAIVNIGTNIGGIVRYAVANPDGEINMTIAQCTELEFFNITIIDFDNKLSKSAELIYSEDKNTYEFGCIIVCDTIDDYVIIKYEDKEFLSIIPSIRFAYSPITGEHVRIQGSFPLGEDSGMIEFGGYLISFFEPQVGDDLFTLIMAEVGVDPNGLGNSILCGLPTIIQSPENVPCENNATLELFEYGQKVRGRISGQLFDYRVDRITYEEKLDITIDFNVTW